VISFSNQFSFHDTHDTHDTRDTHDTHDPHGSHGTRDPHDTHDTRDNRRFTLVLDQPVSRASGHDGVVARRHGLRQVAQLVRHLRRFGDHDASDPRVHNQLLAGPVEDVCAVVGTPKDKVRGFGVLGQVRAGRRQTKERKLTVTDFCFVSDLHVRFSFGSIQFSSHDSHDLTRDSRDTNGTNGTNDTHNANDARGTPDTHDANDNDAHGPHDPHGRLARDTRRFM
jgi:hypothetical protein